MISYKRQEDIHIEVADLAAFFKLYEQVLCAEFQNEQAGT